MVSKIAFLYFTFWAWGCLVLLPVVKLKEVGQGFYRFFGFFCVGLQTLSVGIALYMGPVFEKHFQESAWALWVSLFFTLCFTIALKIRVRWFLWGCFVLAVASGLLALVYFPWVGESRPWLLGVHAAASALLLGAAFLAMMLGHWYLVIPKLSITPLKRYAAFYILLTVFTALELGASYFLYVDSLDRPATLGGELLVHEEIFFVLSRVAWGLLVPLGLAYWIWETVRMRSTQSATGILYASLFCTMIGEAMGLYLTLQTGVPF